MLLLMNQSVKGMSGIDAISHGKKRVFLISESELLPSFFNITECFRKKESYQFVSEMCRMFQSILQSQANRRQVLNALNYKRPQRVTLQQNIFLGRKKTLPDLKCIESSDCTPHSLRSCLLGWLGNGIYQQCFENSDPLAVFPTHCSVS